jgi:hypothetical protein
VVGNIGKMIDWRLPIMSDYAIYAIIFFLEALLNKKFR